MYVFNGETVFELFTEHKPLAERENINPIVFAMLQYALQYELAYKPADFFIRRTGGLFFHYDWVMEHQDVVISYMERTLAWSEEQKKSYKEELTTLLNEQKHLNKKSEI